MLFFEFLNHCQRLSIVLHDELKDGLISDMNRDSAMSPPNWECYRTSVVSVRRRACGVSISVSSLLQRLISKH